MPSPYSGDLRERVLLADAAGLSPAVVAARFGVGLSTVYLWRQQARAEGRRCAKPHGGGRARGIDPAGEAILWGLVAERNDRTLDEYRELLAAGGGPQVSRPTRCRTLRRLGLRRKKRRCAPASGIGPISRRSARSSATFNYPHRRFASSAPVMMSARRDHPRHITMLPGGGSWVRAR